jgi:hypothetical protein
MKTWKLPAPKRRQGPLSSNQSSNSLSQLVVSTVPSCRVAYCANLGKHLFVSVFLFVFEKADRQSLRTIADSYVDLEWLGDYLESFPFIHSFFASPSYTFRMFVEAGFSLFHFETYLLHRFDFPNATSSFVAGPRG